MPKKPVSRRSFIAVAGAAPAAAATGRQPVVVPQVAVTDIKAQQQPLHIVTMYAFEPHEIKQIQAAAPNTKVEITICKDRQEFGQRVKDAEVVYGDVRGDTLQFASKLKWVQSGGAGVEGMDDVMRNSPVVLTNYARTFAHGISETAMGLL